MQESVLCQTEDFEDVFDAFIVKAPMGDAYTYVTCDTQNCRETRRLSTDLTRREVCGKVDKATSHLCEHHHPELILATHC